MYCADILMCKIDILLNYLHLCVCLYREVNYLFSGLTDLAIQIHLRLCYNDLPNSVVVPMSSTTLLGPHGL